MVESSTTFCPRLKTENRTLKTPNENSRQCGEALPAVRVFSRPGAGLVLDDLGKSSWGLTSASSQRSSCSCVFRIPRVWTSSICAWAGSIRSKPGRKYRSRFGERGSSELHGSKRGRGCSSSGRHGSKWGPERSSSVPRCSRSGPGSSRPVLFCSSQTGQLGLGWRTESVAQR